MKRTKKIWVCVILAVILLCIVCWFTNPLLRVKVFVFLNGEQLETALLNGSGVPNLVGIDTFNTWEGEHSMTEFILFSRGLVPGSIYYGCYYSYDDVPLAFQNMGAELVQNGHAYWEWQGDGDNRGATQRLSDHWYYFEAAF